MPSILDITGAITAGLLTSLTSGVPSPAMAEGQIKIALYITTWHFFYASIISRPFNKKKYFSKTLKVPQIILPNYSFVVATDSL